VIQNKSAPNSFESWDARRTALPRSLLIETLRSEPCCGNGSCVPCGETAPHDAHLLRKKEAVRLNAPGERNTPHRQRVFPAVSHFWGEPLPGSAPF
jgi:hypothetical protein